MKKLIDVYNEMKDIISQNEFATPNFEIDCLLEHIYGKKRLDLGNDFLINESDYDNLINLANKRKEGYPLQYMLGEWQFFDLKLKVGKGVLIPRGDTETVCENAMEYLKEINQPVVMDLCSGSGAIALAIKNYIKDSFVVAVEKYDEAFSYLQENVERTKLQIIPIKADIFNFDDKVEEESLDMLISNPPYVALEWEEDLQEEVRHEPREALFAQDNGLRFYKFIAKYYKDAIKEGGYLVFEHGFDQHKYIRNIIEDNGYKYIKEITDTSGLSRGLIARKI